MPEINLMDRYPKSVRPIEERGARRLAGSGWITEGAESPVQQELLFQQLLISRARQFGKEYFDGDRLYGYGGYSYDPKYWSATARQFCDYYRLGESPRILEIGCAKGFLLHELKLLRPYAEIRGLDISAYAVENAIASVKPFLQVGNAKELPFEDGYFDLVLSLSTVDHLFLWECRQALKEIQRVTRGHAFVTVNSWRTEEQRQRLMKWNTAAATTMHVDDWKRLFAEVGYTHDYYWWIPE